MLFYQSHRNAFFVSSQVSVLAVLLMHITGQASGKLMFSYQDIF